jgi:cysteine desulfurase
MSGDFRYGDGCYNSPMLYLDNNATTPMLPEVADSLREAHARGYANPASQHRAGREARAALEEARDGIGEILGADIGSFRADRVIFTSGGTEANNLALRGLIGDPPGRVVVSAVEHPSISDTADFLQTQGWQIDRLPVNRNGVVEINRLPNLFTPETRLASVMLGNNETGVLQPVADVARLCRAAGVLAHTDAVQVVGKLPVDFRALGVDALSCAAHKFHGPRGVGVLVVRHGVELNPILFGGFQQLGARPGTEAVALAIGMHRALQIWRQEQAERTEHLRTLRDRLEANLRQGWPEIVIHGADAERLPHTTSVSFPGLDRQRLLMALDLEGVACSTGSACASGSSELSPVLLAMGLETELIDSALRLSLGRQNTAAEVDDAAARILKVCNNLRDQESRQKKPDSSPVRASKPL